MRIRTQRVVSAAALALVTGCAATAGSAQRGHESDARVAALDARQVEQTRRIEELEARISLLEADARGVRGEHTSGATESGRDKSTRELASAVPEPLEQDAVDSSPAVAPKRPRLHLYGRESADSRAAWPVVPAVSETLPVVPLPEQSAPARLRGSAGGAVVETEVANYRAGLRALRERHWDDAVAAFGAFVTEHPTHELLPSALYWRAEAHYAKREYQLARGELEGLLARFPQAEKAADALLKLALCFRQLGAEEQARGVFRRLRTEYPNSQAATIAVREGST